MSTLTEVNPRLKALTDAGVSVWLDQLGRSLVAGGELKRMVEQESLRGVTSNPSIFEKSILGTHDYDDEIERMARAERSTKEIYDALVIADVQAACDVLASVHEETGGRDGFVSLEVQPDLARDTNGTLASARRYWQAVGRPNVMIKIPGTSEGVGAIEEAIYEGINVNVTLLFAVEAYERVADAYIRGLQRRQAEGKSLDVNSVASFFVSRVDTLVDKQLQAIGGDAPKLAGTAALANARAAYGRFMEIFDGDGWEPLANAGAAVQRPLWASTGVKNPAYPDTLYVDQLVAPHTVNTMPLATLNAIADHGSVPGATARQDPSAELTALAGAGIDMTAVTGQLLEDGIKLFEDAMNELLAGIDERRSAIVTGRPSAIEASLPSAFEQDESTRIKRAVSEHVAQRIWKHDQSLWGGPGVPEIENRLGWLTVSDAMLEQSEELLSFARSLHSEGYVDAVLLGMGGSSLGPEVIRQSFGDRAGGLRLQVLDSTHPDAIVAVERSIELAKTIFVVSSKSGGTIETLSHYRYFKAKCGPEQFVVVTDEGSPLAALAERDGLRRTFLNPSEIGGRYSVLSYFGLVPAALAGVPIDAVLKSAQVGEQACSQLTSSEDNSGLWLGATLGELAREGRDKLTFIVSEPIDSFGLWVEQLVAESTGKKGRGILPVADEPLGDPAAYGDDRVFVYLRNADSPSEQLDGFVDSLSQAGKPTITVATHDATDLGRLFFIAEFAVAVAGWALEINPFDQPNVQEAKDNTQKVLDSGSVPVLEPADDAALRALLGDAQPPHYVAILAYLPTLGPRNEGIDEAISGLRAAIRAATGAATTFGYGPRFQHSTGQEHKGGAPNGRFLQLVDTPVASAEIPGEPYDFTTLIASQAAGDLQTLRNHGLGAERVVLERDLPEAIRALTERIEGILSLSASSAIDLGGLDPEDNPLAEGLEREPVRSTVLVIFGALGDLASRKLLPAIYNLAHEGGLPERIELVGVSRGETSDDEFREHARESIDRFSRRRPDPDVLDGLLRNMRFVSGSFNDPELYAALGEVLGSLDAGAVSPLNRVFYLSTAPEFFPVITRLLGEAGLNEADGAEVRVLIEKPIGYDLASAQAQNEAVLSWFDESQVFRIDHYLGKETVQNLMALRFANALFEPVWNRNFIDNVQITAAEDIGIGTRAGYYEGAGALRDLVQNHMLQLLALLTMEPPTAFEANRLRDEKVKVLEAIVAPTLEEVASMSVRAQYAPGVVAGAESVGYRQEPGVDPQSRTETYAALRLHVSNWRWAGVPFYLRTGKRLSRKLTEIAVTLRPVPHLAFQGPEGAGFQANQIILTLQPDEGVSVSLGAKIPGPRMRIRPVNMEFHYGTSFMSESPEAYERLILDAMRGDATLFTRNDEVEALWAIIDPILTAWAQDTTSPIPQYPAGSAGPVEAEALLEGHSWRRL